MRVFFIFHLLVFGFSVGAQPCANPGQTPGSAFPVCGTSIFDQGTVPACDGRVLPSPNCTGTTLRDVNPYFYKFTCFQGGTLGLLITPKDLQDDYDWEIYDITGAKPDDIYSNGKLVVASNWSGKVGLTGASAAGTTLWSCAGPTQPLISSMPTLKQGHEYLLMVSNFSQSQSGYSLQFKGGTAVITDEIAPRLRKAEVNCLATIVTVKLSKKIKCSSIAANGSDFTLMPSSGVPISAVGVGCGAGFDTDSIQVRFGSKLAPGSYSLQVKQGTDGNTLLDYCNNPIPLTDVSAFTLQLPPPVPMDSLVTPGCSPSTLQLVFSQPMLCSSIAPNGSDFKITGSYPVSIAAASGTCTGGSGKIVTITLSGPLQQAGIFSIELQRGNDGNTILSECEVPTPAGASIPFQVKDTVNAEFSYAVQYGCALDVVNYFHPGSNGVNKWSWILDDGFASSEQNPQASYSIFRTKNIQLIAGNGFCSDTARASVQLDNFLKADFSVTEDNCPEDPVLFTAASIGRITGHEWDFGDGGSGSGPQATHMFSRPTRERIYNVRYTVTDSFGCTKSVQKPVKVYSSCIIAVPNAFTPNGDRVNASLHPLNAIKAEQLDFKVYNRWGQLVFQTNTWKKGWDGTINGRAQPTGSYVWVLRYTNRDTGKRVEQKGYTILIR